MTVVSGYNQQVIRYSPYIDADLLDFEADDFSDEVSTTTYGSSPYL
jgi:hypothetical protein